MWSLKFKISVVRDFEKGLLGFISFSDVVSFFSSILKAELDPDKGFKRHY